MSKITYEALLVDGLKVVLIQVSETCLDLGINFFIVGAIARNIWYVYNDENPNGTKDIDIGIYVPNEIKYNQLRNVLKNKFDYVESSENAFCLITPNGQELDLLPFGEIEKNEQIMVEGKGLTKIKLEGFKEVFDFGVNQILIGEEEYNYCSIAGIMILKMIAFDDRPDERIKDIKDIDAICKYYPQIEAESIWANHSDLYGDDRSHIDVAMVVLGREMKKLIKVNEKLNERIELILNKAINEESQFLSHMIDDPENETITMKVIILTNIKKGMV